MAMNGGQTIGDLPADANHLRRRGPVAAPQRRVERAAFEKLHRHEDDVAFLADLENGDNVWMFDRRDGAGLAKKALARFNGGVESRLHDLEGHRPAEV